MKKLGFSLVVLALALASATGLAGAGVGGTDLPFRVGGTGTVSVVGAGGPFSGTARGTHIGNGTFTGSFAVSVFPPPCGAGTTPLTKTQTLTAANGDTIDQVTTGTLCQSGPTTFHSDETYTITGGTGRFAHATGSGTQIADADLPNGLAEPGTITFHDEGTLSFNH